MKDIIIITLENEMDLILAHKRTMKVAEKIGLTIATQTAFATAVSEVARIVIEHTHLGELKIAIGGEHPKFSLAATIVFENITELSRNHEGFFYAQKLVPEFGFNIIDGKCIIELGIGLPRSLKIDRTKILSLVKFFKDEPPLNAYEEIKNKNNYLSKVTTKQEAEIRQEKLINEKKSEFISIASHEIKTPITVIKAYTQMLQKLKDLCDPRAMAIIEKLDLQTNKLSMLSQQLMDVSQIENGSLLYSLDDIDFNEFLKDVVHMLEHVHSGHKIELALAAGSYKIKGDRLRLEQVFTNLLGNAAKYSASGTAINISYQLVKQEIVIAVRDQGQGMDNESLDAIFQKFYRNAEVEATHPGLGMGLYITSKIIVDHGGKIWAESERHVGSVFYVSLPVLN
ncbi:MAG: HAMP domain-containing histidine kinase [Chitinophagaceae bacterium]|nr:MAG: HAMP domain-containing histidine kinase [Chitinophagaceae bacterium]